MHSRHGADADRRALTARPDPRKTGLTTRGGPSKEPCPRCGKPHPWSECFQNEEADERTLELASRIAPSSPAGKTFRARHPKTTQRRSGGEHSAVGMRASGRGNALDIDAIAETLGPLALEPAHFPCPCVISRLPIGRNIPAFSSHRAFNVSSSSMGSGVRTSPTTRERAAPSKTASGIPPLRQHTLANSTSTWDGAGLL